MANLNGAKRILQLALRIFKLISYFTGLFMQLAYITFLTYGCFTSRGGMQIANIVLLSIAVSYFIFFVILTKFGRDIGAKRWSTFAHKAFKYSKQLVKIYNVGVMVYGFFFVLGDGIGIVAILLCTIMFGFFIAKCFVDATVFILGKLLKYVVFKITTKMKNSNVHPIQSTKKLLRKIKYKFVKVVPAIEISDEEAEAIRAYQELMAETDVVIAEESFQEELPDTQTEELVNQQPEEPTVEKEESSLHKEPIAEIVAAEKPEESEPTADELS